MAKNEFKEIPSLLERLKSTWENINSSKPEAANVNRLDLQTIKEAFVAAANYEELNDRWHQAHALFIDQDQWSKEEQQTNKRKALKEAAEILGIVEGKGRRFHPLKDRTIYEHYTWHQTFFFKDKDGNCFDDDGNFIEETELKKQLIDEIQKKYNFPSKRAVVEYLRDTHSIENLPEFRDHSKKPS
jgi:hypothetical protein